MRVLHITRVLYIPGSIKIITGYFCMHGDIVYSLSIVYTWMRGQVLYIPGSVGGGGGQVLYIPDPDLKFCIYMEEIVYNTGYCQEYLFFQSNRLNDVRVFAIKEYLLCFLFISIFYTATSLIYTKLCRDYSFLNHTS